MTKRHEQCLEALETLGKATAREVSEYFVRMGYSNINERNIAHPRLNELKKMGYVKVVAKKLDPLTNKMVSVYKRTKQKN